MRGGERRRKEVRGGERKWRRRGRRGGERR